jgi:hypothetical protein
MVSLATNFTSIEIKGFLTKDGYVVGTPAFCKEMDRRYVQFAEGVFEERDDWDGTRHRANGTVYRANCGDGGS